MTTQAAAETATKAPETGQSNAAETATTAPPETGDHAPVETDWKAEAEKYQALMRKEEAKAKANAGAARELERLRRESMTEQELAVAQATDKARNEAAAEVTTRLGGELVKARITAAVAGRMSAEQLDALWDRLDIAKFLGADGLPDGDAVDAFAAAIAPDVNQSQTFPDLGQGARGPVATGGPDPLLKALTGKLGIHVP
jgi:hypothetical protein